MKDDSMSYKELQELLYWYIDKLQEKDKEIEMEVHFAKVLTENNIKLKSIIKEVREYIENKEFIDYKKGLGNFERMLKHRQELLEILDKENKE